MGSLCSGSEGYCSEKIRGALSVLGCHDDRYPGLRSPISYAKASKILGWGASLRFARTRRVAASHGRGASLIPSPKLFIDGQDGRSRALFISRSGGE